MKLLDKSSPVKIFLIASLVFSHYVLAEVKIPSFVKEYVSVHLKDRGIFSGELGEWAEGWRELYLENPTDYTTRFIVTDPWSVNLDFNGDGNIDWIGFLVRPINSNSTFDAYVDLYCICSSTGEYEHILILKDSNPVSKGNKIDAGVYLKAPGFLVSQFEWQSDLTISNSSVEFLDFDKGSRIFYWDGSKVEQFTTSD